MTISERELHQEKGRITPENGGRDRRLVWDPALRIFHWALVGLVAFSLWSGKTGGFQVMENHKLSGYSILALLLFRLGWGVWGGYHARFASFVTSPGRALRYVRALAGGRAEGHAGHNPLGAWSVLAMLASLLIQATTGLFASDDILTEGPFHDSVPADVGGWFNWIHYWNSNVLFALIGIHLAAVLFYELKGDRLTAAMIHGRKTLPATTEAPGARGTMWRAAVLAGAAAGAVWTLLANA